MLTNGLTKRPPPTGSFPAVRPLPLACLASGRPGPAETAFPAAPRPAFSSSLPLATADKRHVGRPGPATCKGRADEGGAVVVVLVVSVERGQLTPFTHLLTHELLTPAGLPDVHKPI